MSLTHKLWLPLAGVSAGIFVHNVALSSLEWLNSVLEGDTAEMLGGTNVLVLAIGACAGLAGYFVAAILKGQLEESVRHSAASPSHPLLDASQVPKSPDSWHKFLLLLYGLTAVAFLSAIHAVAHVVWHWFAHGLHLQHSLIMIVSASLALAAAEFVRRQEPPFSEVTSGEPGQSDALILFLSLVTEAEINAFQQTLRETPMPWKKDVITPLGDNRWAPPAGSISRLWENRHLRHIVVIGSDVTWKEFPRFRETVELASALRPVTVHQWPPTAGVDYFDHDAVRGAVRSAYQFLAKQGCTRITIDVTSGTVVCSAVALMETLQPGRGAIYMTKSLDVRAYTFVHRDKGWTPLPEEGV